MVELLNQSSLFCAFGAASTHSKNYHLARHLTLHMTKPCSKHSVNTCPPLLLPTCLQKRQHHSLCKSAGFTRANTNHVLLAAFAHICTSVHAIAPLISLTSHLQLLPAGQQRIIESEQFFFVLMLQNTCLPLPLATCLQKMLPAKDFCVESALKLGLRQLLFLDRLVLLVHFQLHKSSSYSIHISTDALSVRKGIQ